MGAMVLLLLVGRLLPLLLLPLPVLQPTPPAVAAVGVMALAFLLSAMRWLWGVLRLCVVGVGVEGGGRTVSRRDGEALHDRRTHTASPPSQGALAP